MVEHGYTTHEDGSGFGLRIVEGIGNVHGGTLTVTEIDGGGAPFEIEGIEQN